MKTLTFDVPDELAARLSAAAEQSHVSTDELVRSILSGALASAGFDVRDGKRVLPEIPTWDSGDPHLARKVDEILGAEWAQAIERGR